MEVVLKDVSLEAAEKGKAYSEKLLDKQLEKGRIDAGEERRVPRPHHADRRLRRPRGLRHRRRGRVRERRAQALGVRRARADRHPGRAARLQHLDAADHRPRRGRQRVPRTSSASTSSRRSTRCRWSRSSPARRPTTRRSRTRSTTSRQIKKTPIVVNDSRGFFTSRVIGQFINEGLGMLAEGVNPVSIDRAATQAGLPDRTAPDQRRAQPRADEEDPRRLAEGRRGRGRHLGAVPASEDVIDKMIELGRTSKLVGKGFFDYDENGKRAGLWPGLAEHFPVAAEQPTFQDLKDRLVFVDVARHGALPRGGRAAHGRRTPTSARSSASASRPCWVARCSTSTATRRRTAASASRRSPSGRRSWPRSTASASSPRRCCSTRPRTASFARRLALRRPPRPTGSSTRAKVASRHER